MKSTSLSAVYGKRYVNSTKMQLNFAINIFSIY